MTICLTLDNFRLLCYELATAANWNTAQEPIPDFDTRYPGQLESCLATPEQTFDSQPLYPTLADKAAILFYLLVKNHPFKNGNKRLAVTTLTVFLFLNGKWITVSPDHLYQFTMGVAVSEARDKDRAIAAIKDFLNGNMADSLGSISGSISI
jgi:death-on-curing family protein